jgi:hypothetical protein
VAPICVPSDLTTEPLDPVCWSGSELKQQPETHKVGQHRMPAVLEDDALGQAWGADATKGVTVAGVTGGRGQTWGRAGGGTVVHWRPAVV